MYDRDPISRWVDGRLLLTGDAAHPMLQYLAQGACQSIEDARAQQVDGDRHPEPPSREIPKRGTGRHASSTESGHRARPACSGQHGSGGILARRRHRPNLRNMLFSGRDPKDYRYTDWLYSDTI